MIPSRPSPLPDPLRRVRAGWDRRGRGRGGWARTAPAVALLACLAAPLCAGPASAAPLALSLPAGATEGLNQTETATLALPTAPVRDGDLPVEELSGQVTTRSWRLPGTSRTTLQILMPLRDQLVEAGFTPLLDCATDICGGFDFRFAAPILPPPDIYVDLFDFRAFSARRETEAGTEAVFLLVSRSEATGFVQITHVAPEGPPADVSTTPDADPTPVFTPGSALVETLVDKGHVVLSDLAFATGSAELEDSDYPSLTALADFLKERPAARVALVGHTDTEGTLEGNMALSRRRAEAVRSRLQQRHGVANGQLMVEGIGYLAPVTGNASEAGRERNRRVEAVLTEEP